jgi:hypothetical protein
MEKEKVETMNLAEWTRMSVIPGSDAEYVATHVFTTPVDAPAPMESILDEMDWHHGDV